MDAPAYLLGKLVDYPLSWDRLSPIRRTLVFTSGLHVPPLQGVETKSSAWGNNNAAGVSDGRCTALIHHCIAH
jgi:hypothetical protein